MHSPEDEDIGTYSWVRLEVADDQPGYLELADGTVHDLTIPSGAQSGFKLVGGFSASINGPNQFVLDFDLRKSVHRAGRKYLLKPTLRLIKLENPAKQSLTGEWLLEEMGECSSPMVYVYDGSDTVPDDIGGVGNQPITTAALTANEDDSHSTFKVNYISYGNYTIAYTCGGAEDGPESDDDIEFKRTENVSVWD